MSFSDTIDEFTNAVKEAVAFTDQGPDDEWQDADWSQSLTDKINADCHSFWWRCWYYVKATDMTPAQAGHDFWLTRNGHGAGFWDGDWDHTPYAEILTKLSKCYGELGVSLNDDNELDF